MAKTPFASNFGVHVTAALFSAQGHRNSEVFPARVKSGKLAKNLFSLYNNFLQFARNVRSKRYSIYK